MHHKICLFKTDTKLKYHEDIFEKKSLHETLNDSAMWHLKHADVTLTLLKRQSLVSS